MSKCLVIVESPAKSKTIKKYLGKDYEVKASKGHIVDLPKSELGVDVDKNYKPKYVVTKRKALQDLKKSFEGKDCLILAVDPDREGEAIGWHVANKLGVITDSGKVKKGKELIRIVFTSITKDAVQDALKNPRKVDENLYNAQQARRVLDRLVGYKLSPLLWKKIQFGLSAGRVQSVALRLVVEREEERDAFVPDEYWTIKSYLSNEKKGEPELQIKLNDEEKSKDNVTNLDYVEFILDKIGGKKTNICKEKEVCDIYENVKDKEWVISDIKTSEQKRNPKPPFTTSTFQQTVLNTLGIGGKQAMRVAQKLYESGLITYMRTDSLTLSPEAVNGARKYLLKNFGEKYVPEKPKLYKTKAKVAQEAHEAIRPTDFSKSPDSVDLEGQDLKIYTIIWQRALASQMVSAKLKSVKVIIDLDKYSFQATGQNIVFDGYLKIYQFDKVKEFELPDMKKGDILYLKLFNGLQSFTKPSARYTEASLIKKLEELGVGRPSTYVPTISTIVTRRYVEKDGKYFFPTDMGKIVIRLLKDHFPNIVDYSFTAKMEDSLDAIANGEGDWVKLIDEFYSPFEKQLDKKMDSISREDYKVLGDAPTHVKCPECGAKMNMKIGRYGKFYSCTKWPDCKGMLGLDEKTQEEFEKEAQSKQFQSIYKEAPKTDDNRNYILKRGRFGKFWAHPDYPKVKDAQPLEYNSKINEEIYGKPPKAKDGSEMVLRKGKYGEYWAHSDYPKVKEVQKIDKEVVKDKKIQLGIEKE